MNKLHIIAVLGISVLTTGALAAEREPLDVFGETVTVKVYSQDSSGAISVVEILTPPELGPPPHANSREVLVFYVIEGTVRFFLGDESFDRGPGELVLIPQGAMHTYQNVGEAPSRMLLTLAPGGFERFFEEVHARDFQLPDDMAEFEALAAEYGMELGPPPE